MFANPPTGIPASELILTRLSSRMPRPLPVGGGGITKLGSGLLDIQANGVYTGPNDIQAGAVQFENNTALGLASDRRRSSTTTVESRSQPGPQRIPCRSSMATSPKASRPGPKHLVLSGSGDAALGYSSPLVLPAGSDNVWRGPVTLATDVTFSVPTNSRLTLGGTIDDAVNAAADGSVS